MACLLFGCNAAMVMNGKVMGISSGKFIYQDGYLTTQYKADIEPVWKACEKAVIDLKGQGHSKRTQNIQRIDQDGHFG